MYYPSYGVLWHWCGLWVISLHWLSLYRSYLIPGVFTALTRVYNSGADYVGQRPVFVAGSRLHETLALNY